jgi:hypothetical protein
MKAISFKSLPSMVLLKLLASCGGILELLAPWEATVMGIFLTTGYSLPPVDFSAASGWLELPAPWVNLPELLARH